MNLNWSNRVIKYVLFVFNLLFVISGIIMVAVGASVKSYYTDYDIFLNGSYFSLPNLLIAIGSLIFFISFFGCCGAIRESWFMIFIFSILLCIIFILEFSAGIAGYVLRDNTASFLTDELLESMKKYSFYPNKPNPTTYAWDEIQTAFRCCGANGPKDWPDMDGKTTTPPPESSTPSLPTISTNTAKSSASANETTSPTNATLPSETPTPVTTLSSTTVTKSSTSETTLSTSTNTSKTEALVATDRDKNDLPASCCTPVAGASGTVTCVYGQNNTTGRYFTQGCVDGFGDYLKDHAVTIGGVGLAIAFIQLFGIIFACHLTKQLKHGFYST